MSIKNVRIGSDEPLTIIAGPCVAESLQMCMDIGKAMRDRCAELGLSYIFKASYDKANRSSIGSARGPGMEEGLDILRRVGEALQVPVTTDIHTAEQAQQVAASVDLLQIPAFLCRQTDLLTAAAKTGKPVNVKKGQFISPAEMAGVAGKLISSGASRENVMLTERGTFFGYNRLVNDFVGLGDMMELGYPVCFDVTHSTQQPGATGEAGAPVSGGRPERAPLLARCAVAAGVQALFIETHPEPSRGLSDAATMLPVAQTLELLPQLAALKSAIVSAKV